MSGMTTVMRRLLVAAALVAVCAGWSHSAEASTYIASELGNAGPSNWAILGLGGVNVNLTDEVLNGPGQTVGNVAVASSGNIALSSSTPPAIIGNLYLGNTATTGGSSCAIPPDNCNQVSGNVFTNQDALLGTATGINNYGPSGTVVANAIDAYKDFNALMADQTISGDITSSMTLSCSAGQLADGKCVIDVTGKIDLGNDKILTLLGTPTFTDESFILRVAGIIKLNGGDKFKGGQIRLGGTLDSSDDAVIVSNKVGTGDTITASGGSSDPCNATSQTNLGALASTLCQAGSNNTLPNAFIQGILLAPQGGIGFSPGMVIGEIIGGGNEIRLVSGSQVIGQSTTGISTGISSVPAPASLVLLMTAMAGWAATRRRLRLG